MVGLGHNLSESLIVELSHDGFKFDASNGESKESPVKNACPIDLIGGFNEDITRSLIAGFGHDFPGFAQQPRSRWAYPALILLH